ncbi:arsenic efflux protein [Sulfitobacter sp. 1151]|uniref:Arsenic efflux protein n=2 Tax=Parasulfitobacter algicola TaxID=2614809 RepID=A0ABX2INH7_9RHOB|nr:arsenic efflux protein [Sulfitobacter algicola]
MTPDTLSKTSPARAIFGLPEKLGPLRTNRLIFTLLIMMAAAMPGQFGEVTQGTLYDAYIGVTVFVAGTLLLFYGAEKIFKFDIGASLRNAKWAQVPAAALMGAMPGCGGAVVVVAAYSSGNVGMGAVVAALTATMGDAAFLLIATRPDAALVLLPISLFVGVITGWIVDRFDHTHLQRSAVKSGDIAPIIGNTPRKRDYLYAALVLPGIVFGIMDLAQVELTAALSTGVHIMAMAAIAIGLLIWTVSPVKATTNPADGAIARMTEETSFITVWVLGAFLAYEYLVVFGGLDLQTIFSSVAMLLPLIAILIGFIPGCGPQVLVTTLYINGLVPFAALIGNAISNDGDALFPAIALNPKAAVVATVYSAIPALIVAYGFFFLAPGFMN